MKVYLPHSRGCHKLQAAGTLVLLPWTTSARCNARRQHSRTDGDVTQKPTADVRVSHDIPGLKSMIRICALGGPLGNGMSMVEQLKFFFLMEPGCRSCKINPKMAGDAEHRCAAYRSYIRPGLPLSSALLRLFEPLHPEGATAIPPGAPFGLVSPT